MYKATLSFTTKDYDVRKNQILAEDFTTQSEIDEYLSIGYIVEYDETLEITQNGLYDVKEYEQANVDVPSGEPTLQSKSVTITTNTTTNIQADEGYDGLSNVAVTTNVSADMSEYFNSNWRLGSGSSNGISSNMKKIPALRYINNYSSASQLCQNMFSLEDASLLDISGVTSIQWIFASCEKLTNIGNPDTSLVTSFYEAFLNCSSLVNVPVLNTSHATNFSNCFGGCSALSNESLNNILQMCINATAFNGTKTLKKLGLTSAQATTCQSLSNWDAFVSAGWTTGY